MNAQPVLSIVVTAYNVERYIEPCLRSILAQLGAHHALIVIDDGSTDATPALVERLRRAHGNVNLRVIGQSNLGIASTRNEGIAAATGEYIMFVDGDDLLLPGALAALDQVIEQHRPDVIACDFEMWHPGQESKNRRVTLGYPAGVLLAERETILRKFFADRQMYVWANVFRRAVYQRIPAPVFPPGRAFEDVSALAHLLGRCDNLFHLAHPIVGYRQHPASIVKAISEKSCLDLAAALRQVKTGFEGQPVSDAVKLQIDVTASHFYIGIVKNSYQLPWPRGRAVRSQVKAIYLDSLFHRPERVLAAMSEPGGPHHSRDDAAAAGQVRQSLSGSVMFDVTRTLSRKIKLWRRARKNRRAAA